MRGGELVFRMGPRPNRTWGARTGDAPATRIDGERLVPVPVIRSAGATFRDKLSVSMRTTTPALRVHYTTDGAEPDARTTPYSTPLVIERPTTVKAFAVDESGARSFTVTARFHRIPHDWKISTRSKYAPQYSAGGDLALIDGLRGAADFRTGAWQGFQGQDFEAMIDLGKVGARREARRGLPSGHALVDLDAEERGVRAVVGRRQLREGGRRSPTTCPTARRMSSSRISRGASSRGRLATSGSKPTATAPCPRGIRARAGSRGFSSTR